MVEVEQWAERRGLETRATATTAAALTSIAFSANAVSDDLRDAHALPIMFLAIGAVALLTGILLNGIALLGRRAALEANRFIDELVSKLALVTPLTSVLVGGSPVPAATIGDLLARRREARQAADLVAVRAATRLINRSLLQCSAQLRSGSGWSCQSLSRESATAGRAARPTTSRYGSGRVVVPAARSGGSGAGRR